MMSTAMCGPLNLLLSIYLTGVFFGLMGMMIGQGVYDRHMGRAKPDIPWLLKISMLSWIAVLLAVLLIHEVLNHKNDRVGDDKD